MNVVIANENKNIIDRLSIDIIKRIDGEYEVRELMGKLVNLYFNKMIIDITAIKNYLVVSSTSFLGHLTSISVSPSVSRYLHAHVLPLPLQSQEITSVQWVDLTIFALIEGQISVVNTTDIAAIATTATAVILNSPVASFI